VFVHSQVFYCAANHFFCMFCLSIYWCVSPVTGYFVLVTMTCWLIRARYFIVVLSILEPRIYLFSDTSSVHERNCFCFFVVSVCWFLVFVHSQVFYFCHDNVPCIFLWCLGKQLSQVFLEDLLLSFVCFCFLGVYLSLYKYFERCFWIFICADFP